jgi:hypothetical protein
MSETHYCIAGEQHNDGCKCDCYICENKRCRKKQEEFNRALIAKIREEIKLDLECQKAYAEAAEIMKRLEPKRREKHKKQ